MIHDKKKIQWINLLRGLLILAVIWGHSQLYWDGIGRYVTYSYMAVFFFLSGYLTDPTKKMPLRQYVKSKARRLLLPVVVYGVVLCLVASVRNGFSIGDFLYRLAGTAYSRYKLFVKADENIFFLQSCNSILWFLPASFGAALLTEFYLRTRWKKTMLVVYVLAAMMCSYLPVLLPWSLDTISLYAVFMIAGCYYRKAEATMDAMPKKMRRLLFNCSALVYIALVTVNRPVNFSIRIYGPYGFASVVATLLIGLLGSYLFCRLGLWIERRKYLSWLGYIGEHSMTYMCVHLLALSMAEDVVGLLFFPAVAHLPTAYAGYLIRLVCGVAGIISALIISYGTTRLWTRAYRKGLKIFRYL